MVAPHEDPPGDPLREACDPRHPDSRGITRTTRNILESTHFLLDKTQTCAGFCISLLTEGDYTRLVNMHTMYKTSVSNGVQANVLIMYGNVQC